MLNLPLSIRAVTAVTAVVVVLRKKSELIHVNARWYLLKGHAIVVTTARMNPSLQLEDTSAVPCAQGIAFVRRQRRAVSLKSYGSTPGLVSGGSNEVYFICFPELLK
eukprot:SAG22_NODE_245_length_13962_cov_11.954555_8_plen_107_part_00